MIVVELSSAQLAHTMGRSVASLAKLRSKYATFPRPRIAHPACFYNAAAVRAWIEGNAGSISPTYPNEKALDIGLFDERLTLILAQRVEPTT